MPTNQGYQYFDQTASKCQSHIDDLAKELGCEVRQGSHIVGWGMMYVEFGYVEGPFITQATDYFILLHELGHVAHGHTQGRPPKGHERFYFDNGVLKSEAEAWNWALDRTRLEPSSYVRRFMWDVCMGSYYQHYLSRRGQVTRLGNGDRDHVAFVFDHPDDYFADTVKRLQGGLKNMQVPYVGRYDERLTPGWANGRPTAFEAANM